MAKTKNRKDQSSTQRGYNTNLASEFYILSMLHRLGFNANLTLGNKKSVDVGVILGPGHAITIDVKAVAGKMDWLMGTPSAVPQPGHFVVLVSYEGQFVNPLVPPRCWILRHEEVLPMIKSAGVKEAMWYLSRKQVLETFGAYEGAWGRLALPA